MWKVPCLNFPNKSSCVSHQTPGVWVPEWATVPELMSWTLGSISMSLFFILCMWTYFHVWGVSLTVPPGSGDGREGSVCMIKLSSLEVEEECSEGLLRKTDIISRHTHSVLVSPYIIGSLSHSLPCSPAPFSDLPSVSTILYPFLPSNQIKKKKKSHCIIVLYSHTIYFLFSLFSLPFPHLHTPFPLSPMEKWNTAAGTITLCVSSVFN